MRMEREPGLTRVSIHSRDWATKYIGHIGDFILHVSSRHPSDFWASFLWVNNLHHRVERKYFFEAIGRAHEILHESLAEMIQSAWQNHTSIATSTSTTPDLHVHKCEAHRHPDSHAYKCVTTPTVLRPSHTPACRCTIASLDPQVHHRAATPTQPETHTTLGCVHFMYQQKRNTVWMTNGSPILFYINYEILKVRRIVKCSKLNIRIKHGKNGLGQVWRSLKLIYLEGKQ